LNPVTRLIVSRTPVDANAVLLKHRETCKLLRAAGLVMPTTRHFLFLPEVLYRRTGDAFENLLGGVPVGGQYAVFASVPN
jgi:hypothetical protein